MFCFVLRNFSFFVPFGLFISLYYINTEENVLKLTIFLTFSEARLTLGFLTLHLKQPEKEEMKNPRISRRKEILKIRAEINAKETKETIAKNQQS